MEWDRNCRLWRMSLVAQLVDWAPEVRKYCVILSICPWLLMVFFGIRSIIGLPTLSLSFFDIECINHTLFEKFVQVIVIVDDCTALPLWAQPIINLEEVILKENVCRKIFFLIKIRTKINVTHQSLPHGCEWNCKHWILCLETQFR